MNINKCIFFSGILLFISSCSIKKSPLFIKVDIVKLISVASDTIKLEANAFFKNPNVIGGKMATDKIKVIVNGVEVAQVSSKQFKVPAKKEFTIPLKVVILTKHIFENNKNGVLGGLLNSVFNKSIKVQFKGNIKYTVLGFSNIYPINTTQEIKIKF